MKKRRGVGPRKADAGTLDAFVWSRVRSAATWLLRHGDVLDCADALDLLGWTERSECRHRAGASGAGGAPAAQKEGG